MYLLKPFLAGAFAGAGAFKMLLTLLFEFSGHIPAALQTQGAHGLLTAATSVVSVAAGAALAWNVRDHRLARSKKA